MIVYRRNLFDKRASTFVADDDDDGDEDTPRKIYAIAESDTPAAYTICIKTKGKRLRTSNESVCCKREKLNIRIHTSDSI